MTVVTDVRGLAMTGATAEAAAHFDEAVSELSCYRGDPLARVDAAIAAAPGFAMAHAMKAWLYLLSTEPGAVPAARDACAEASRRAATAREKGHVAALERLMEGRWRAAARTLEDVTLDAPRDLLGLIAGHQLDFLTGDARMLRDRIARARPAWDGAVPGLHSVLGMHAFGLEETGDYARAEAEGRRGVELEARDGWSQHAVAHVYEMTCRQKDGVAWMRANVDGWAGDSFFQVHNWWHLALYHLEAGEFDAVLALYDNEMGRGVSGVAMDMVDASAMLWRLGLRGVDLGDRRDVVADRWAAMGEGGFYAFNDVHAVMAHVGAGRWEAAQAVIEAQRAAMAGPGDNAQFTREVGHDVCRGLIAFGEGRFADCVGLLRPIRSISARMGGSHAQRDVIDLTLIEAALKAGMASLAGALVAERAEARHATPLTQLFTRRAQTLRNAA
jgi:hypothetical protein